MGENKGIPNSGFDFDKTAQSSSLPEGGTSRGGPRRTSVHSSVDWWRPWAVLALTVHEALVSVGEWALTTAQSSVGNLVTSARRRTSLVYESVKYRSSVAVQDCQEVASTVYEDLHGRLQTRYTGATDKLFRGYARCKENAQLAVLGTKLRVQLATNRIQLGSEALSLEARTKLSERYDVLVVRPLVAARAKLRSVRSVTGSQVTQCKSKLAGNFKGNLDSLTLKAMEYEDNIEGKFPGIAGKPVKSLEEPPSRPFSTSPKKCLMAKVAQPAPHPKAG